MWHNEEWKDVLNHLQIFHSISTICSQLQFSCLYSLHFSKKEVYNQVSNLRWRVVIYGNTMIQVPLIMCTKLMAPQRALQHFLNHSFYLTLSDLCPVKGLFGQGVPFSLMSLNHGHCWVPGSCNIFPSERPEAVLRVSWICHILFRAEVPVKMIL